MHIIVDGYNLIRQSKRFSKLDLQDIQAGRQSLIDALAEYRREKNHRITVVFDGTGVVGMDWQKDRVKGVTVEFSRYGQTADDLIKQKAAREKENALVVSSDRDIVRFSTARGAVVIGSREFEGKLIRTMQPEPSDPVPEAENNVGWVPTTRKKGPSRRRSKKERKRMKKIGKL